MDCRQTHEPSVFALARFQKLIADLHDTVDHLAEIEEQMAQAVTDMKAQGHPRQHLLVSESMLTDLRGLLATALPYRKSPPNEFAASERHLTVG